MHPLYTKRFLTNERYKLEHVGHWWAMLQDSGTVVFKFWNSPDSQGAKMWQNVPRLLETCAKDLWSCQRLFRRGFSLQPQRIDIDWVRSSAPSDPISFRHLIPMPSASCFRFRIQSKPGWMIDFESRYLQRLDQVPTFLGFGWSQSGSGCLKAFNKMLSESNTPQPVVHGA